MTEKQNIVSNLVGLYASWYSDRGHVGGPIMAVYVSAGYPELLVSVDGKLTRKGAEGVEIR